MNFQHTYDYGVFLHLIFIHLRLIYKTKKIQLILLVFVFIVHWRCRVSWGSSPGDRQATASVVLFARVAEHLGVDDLTAGWSTGDLLVLVDVRGWGCFVSG